MTHPAIVARVLLVAVPEQQRALEPWLRVEGEIVAYDLRMIEPEEVLGFLDDAWDLILVDGASLASDDARELLLTACSKGVLSPSAVLYLCTVAPSPDEERAAVELASDYLERGAWFGPRLGRRVQVMAFAPWRRNIALRLRAQRAGHLRLLSPRSRDGE